jgi:hypothetical protein
MRRPFSFGRMAVARHALPRINLLARTHGFGNERLGSVTLFEVNSAATSTVSTS